MPFVNMRNPNRIALLMELIEQEWLNHPDFRFFQFIDYLKAKIPKSERGFSQDCFYTEDESLFRQLCRYNQEIVG